MSYNHTTDMRTALDWAKDDPGNGPAAQFVRAYHHAIVKMLAVATVHDDGRGRLRRRFAHQNRVLSTCPLPTQAPGHLWVSLHGHVADTRAVVADGF